VVAITDELVFGCSGEAKARFLRAVGVRGRNGLDGSEISPRTAGRGKIVVEIFFTPAICWACGERGSSLRGSDAIERIVAERLRARGHAIVGDAGDVSIVAGAETEVVREVENVPDVSGIGTRSGRSAGAFCRDAAGLKARVVIERADESAPV